MLPQILINLKFLENDMFDLYYLNKDCSNLFIQYFIKITKLLEQNSIIERYYKKYTIIINNYISRIL